MRKSEQKQMRKKLRELAILAYERELGVHLGKLQEDFSKWREGKISVYELSDRIHEFHHGPSRELYNLNEQLKPDFLVARAVSLSVLSEDELPNDILEMLSKQIESLRSLPEEDSTG
jgi:hypothetical protein